MSNWDLEVSLLKISGETKNKIGDKIPTYEKVEILAFEKAITRGELIIAGQSNIQISKIVVIHGFEYSNEELLEIEGVRYQVVSSYKISNEELELKLKSKKGGA